MDDFDLSISTASHLPSRLIQLVPRFRPDVDGLGDCAAALADALWKQCAVASDFVVWRPSRPVAELEIPGGEGYPHRIFRSEKQTAEELREILDRLAERVEKPVMLMHYTSYAYSNQGTAWWLPGVLRRFEKRGGTVIGFFHELYATGRFPSKTWMSSKWQHRIFRQMLELCFAAATSNSDYLDQMQRDNVARHPLVLAGVCSNVGELESLPPFAERKRTLIIFGKYPTRMGLYQQHMPALKQFLTHLNIQEVADIGEIGPMRDTFMRFGEALDGKLRIYGPLPSEQVSELMKSSVAGAVNYDFRLRFKSGVVGAYQAHGLPVILFNPKGSLEPAESDPTCVSAAQLLSKSADSAELMNLLEGAGTAGFAFYREHRSYDSVLRQILPLMQLS